MWQLLFNVPFNADAYQWYGSGTLLTLNSGWSRSSHFLIKISNIVLDVQAPSPQPLNYTPRTWLNVYCQIGEFANNSVNGFPEIQMGKIESFFPVKEDIPWDFPANSELTPDIEIYLPYHPKPGDDTGRVIGIRKMIRSGGKNKFFGRINMFGDMEGKPTRFGQVSGGLFAPITGNDDKFNLDCYEWIPPSPNQLSGEERNRRSGGLSKLQQEIFSIIATNTPLADVISNAPTNLDMSALYEQLSELVDLGLIEESPENYWSRL